MPKKYKKPSDYPQFAFRLSKRDKERLVKEIDNVHSLANKDIADDEFKINKNRIILHALETGLKTIKKQKKWGTQKKKKYVKKMN